MHAIPAPPAGIPARRVADEASIVDLVVLHGYALDVRRGERTRAERDARETLERWIGLGLGHARAADGSRRFDPAEVLCFAKFAGRRLGDPFARERALVQGRSLALAFHPGATSPDAPPPVDTLPAERFVVTLEREFDVSRGARGAPILLRLPAPVPDPTLTDVDVSFVGPAGAELTQAPGRLDVRLAHPGTRTLTCGARIAFSSTPSHAPAAVDPGEAQRYLSRAEGIVKVSPRIAALGGRVAGSAREPLDRVRRWVDFLADTVTIGGVAYDRLSPAAPLDTVLDDRWLDCQLASALLVGLCRADGIPARLVSGYLLTPTPAGHYWAEVAIDGRWLPFDSAAAELADGGRDAAWRDYYFGRLDHRLKTQVLPRTFNLSPSVRLPPRWYSLPRLDGDGASVATYDCVTGALVYRERLSVQRGSSVNATPL